MNARYGALFARKTVSLFPFAELRVIKPERFYEFSDGETCGLFEFRQIRDDIIANIRRNPAAVQISPSDFFRPSTREDSSAMTAFF